MRLRVKKYISFIETIINFRNAQALSVYGKLYYNACCCTQEGNYL